MNWYELGREGLTLQVHVQPGAKRTEVAGLHGDCIKIRLAAPPVDGRANACLIEFLARRLGAKRTLFTITRGATSRRKTVFVAALQLQPELLLQKDTAA